MGRHRVLDTLGVYHEDNPYGLLACYIIKDAFATKDTEFFKSDEVKLWAKTACISDEKVKNIAVRCLDAK